MRAVAVVAVLLAHAGVPGVAGGFVGVDVFFVISGFLITGILIRAREAGTFSILNFYHRRARRILPALFVMLAVTTLVAAYVLSNADLASFADSLAGATLSVANWVFYYQSGYFDAAAAEKPLLHTWTLGIEEQFYLVFPLLVWWLGAPRHRRLLIALLALGAGASFLLNLWLTPERGPAAFFWSPPRAWELAVGALIALVPLRPGRAQRELLAAAGLVLVLAACVSFGPRTAFPGWAVLLPVAGAALLIVGNGAGDTLVGRLLSLKPVAAVGLISYSLYLWHWPLLVFGRYTEGRAQPLWVNLLLVTMAVAIAAASWRFVEQPIRRAVDLPGAGKRALWAGGLGAAALVAAAVALPSLPRPWQSDPAIVRANAAAADPQGLGADCHVSEFAAAPAPAPRCRRGPAWGYFLIWGDSHANSLAPGLARSLAGAGFGALQSSKSSCPPGLGLTVAIEGGTRSDSCGRFNRAVLETVLADPKLRGVILAARWPVYLTTRGFDNDPDRRIYLSLRPGDPVDAAASAAAVDASVAATIAAIRRARGADFPVILLSAVPEAGFDVPNCLIRTHLSGRSSAACGHVPAAGVRRRLAAFAPLRDHWVRLDPQLVLIDPAPALCGAERCRTMDGERIDYRDSHHLTREGSAALAERLSADPGWRRAMAAARR